VYLISEKIVFSLTAVGAFVFLLLLIRNYEKALQILMIVSIPLQGYFPLFKRGGRPTILLTVADIAFLLLLFNWFLKKKKGGEFSFYKNKWPQLFYFFSLIPSAIISDDFSASLVYLFEIGKFYLVFCYIHYLAKKTENLIFLFNCFLYLNLFIVSALFINRYFISIDNFYGFEFLSRRIFIGNQIMILILILLGALFLKNDNRAKFLEIILFGLSIFALIVNQSRGAWIAFCAGLIIFFMVGARAKIVKMRSIILIITIITLVVIAGIPILQHRLKERFQDPSAQNRIPLMKLAFEIGAKNPLFGIGINNYRFEMKNYINESTIEIPWIAVVHNQYLLLWAETGIIGVIGFISMIALTLIKGIEVSKVKSHIKVLSCTLVAAMVGHVTQSLFDSFRETWLLWGIMGIISGLHTQLMDIRSYILVSHNKIDCNKAPCGLL
jgi:O-antigen ligase